jgi:hypothetical protein
MMRSRRAGVVTQHRVNGIGIPGKRGITTGQVMRTSRRGVTVSHASSRGADDERTVRMSRQVFAITVAGEMDEELRKQFDDVEVTVEHGVTRLRAVCPDPSVLHGVLHRLDDLGLELLDVRPIGEMLAP